MRDPLPAELGVRRVTIGRMQLRRGLGQLDGAREHCPCLGDPASGVRVERGALGRVVVRTLRRLPVGSRKADDPDERVVLDARPRLLDSEAEAAPQRHDPAAHSAANAAISPGRVR